MTYRSLDLHRDFTCRAATAVDVEIDLAPSGLLRLGYRVTGDLHLLHLPPAVAPLRTDELWKTTCFEAFIQPSDGPAYYEFNLSPSTAWASYGFTGPRQDMRPALEIPAPRIETMAESAGFQLGAEIELPLNAFPVDRPWRVGLTAVIEDTFGGKTYWALAHPAGAPDFHSSDGRVLELTASEQR
jgi:hypothetical protein